MSDLVLIDITIVQTAVVLFLYDSRSTTDF